MTQVPTPHPLDFDWRYDDATTRALAEIVGVGAPVLCVGAPSVARALERRRVDVCLVDRQPLQGVRSHFAVEIEHFAASRRFKSALLDPPWYPDDAASWAAHAAQFVEIGGAIYLSLWPTDTRPGAESEIEGLIGSFRAWSEVALDVANLKYVTPPFETSAAAQTDSPLAHSPRHGTLAKLVVKSIPPRPSVGLKPHWHRFVFNDYQLALRSDDPIRGAFFRPVPNARGWKWPFVSARAPGRELINLWSSVGEVAQVGDTTELLAALRQMCGATDRVEFERALANFPELLSWALPRPPFERVLEWSHRQ